MRSGLIAVAAELRRRIELQLFSPSSVEKANTELPLASTDRSLLVHEVELLKIELEMRSLELDRARSELAAALEKKTHPCDVNPVGYISTNVQGEIFALNVAAATLLAIEPSKLFRRRELLTVSPNSRSVFRTFLRNVFAQPRDHSCEVQLQRTGGADFWADFWSVTPASFLGDSKRRLIAFRDVSARKLTALLSSREMEVLRLIVAGKPNKQVAAELRISSRTIEKHRMNLMAKLKLHDLASLTRFAISAGVVDLLQHRSGTVSG